MSITCWKTAKVNDTHVGLVFQFLLQSHYYQSLQSLIYTLIKNKLCFCIKILVGHIIVEVYLIFFCPWINKLLHFKDFSFNPTHSNCAVASRRTGLLILPYWMVDLMAFPFLFEFVEGKMMLGLVNEGTLEPHLAIPLIFLACWNRESNTTQNIIVSTNNYNTGKYK